MSEISIGPYACTYEPHDVERRRFMEMKVEMMKVRNSGQREKARRQRSARVRPIVLAFKRVQTRLGFALQMFGRRETRHGT